MNWQEPKPRPKPPDPLPEPIPQPAPDPVPEPNPDPGPRVPLSLDQGKMVGWNRSARYALSLVWIAALAGMWLINPVDGVLYMAASLVAVLVIERKTLSPTRAPPGFPIEPIGRRDISSATVFRARGSG